MLRRILAAAVVLFTAAVAQAANTTPDEANKKLIESRAVEAVIWGMPAVNYDLMLQEFKRIGGKENQIVYWSRPLDGNNQTLTPNPDSIYFMAFYNTKDGPVVLEIPPAGDDGSINANIVTTWQMPLADGGPYGTDKGQGGKYLLLPPGYTGSVPEGYIPLQSDTPNATVYPGKQWEYANMVELDQEGPIHTQLDERGSWFYEAIGETAGMQGRIVGFGQAYLETSKDKSGNWLDGGKTYRLHVDADPPVGQFWSITLYDNVTRGPVITDQGAADLSSRKHDLAKNPDGSVDVYFGPEKPAGATNWIKTTPGKGWFPYFRFYAPQQAYFDKTWQLNDIEKVN